MGTQHAGGSPLGQVDAGGQTGINDRYMPGCDQLALLDRALYQRERTLQLASYRRVDTARYRYSPLLQSSSRGAIFRIFYM